MTTVESKARFDALRRDYFNFLKDSRSSEGIHDTELQSMLRDMKTDLETRGLCMPELQDEKNKLEQEIEDLMALPSSVPAPAATVNENLDLASDAPSSCAPSWPFSEEEHEEG